MEVTRQGYAVVGLVVGLVLLSVVLSAPLLLVGAAGLGGWLLAQQWRYVQAVTSTTEELRIEYALTREHMTVEESTTVSVTAECDVSKPVSVRVTPKLPVGTTALSAPDWDVTLEPGDTSDTVSFTITAPTAGRYQFSPAAVTLTDQAGLFRTKVTLGEQPTLTARPRQPDDLHVGEGGERVGAFGAFRADQRGEGVEPAEVREYVPGDSTERIDWNATARLGKPHILEFEADTDRRTVLVVDHRSSLGIGPPGKRALDYLRQTALAFLEAASYRNQATGLLTVGDSGITNRLRPATGNNHYSRIRQKLLELESGEPEPDRMRTPAGTTVQRRHPAEAARTAAVLDGDDSPFGRSLRPFFSETTPYVQRIEERPLYETVRTLITKTDGTLVTMLLTDDTRQTELSETVDVGARGDSHVAAFLTPAVLFEQGTFGDLSAAYDRYVEFESFRRKLSGHARVNAYEVAPESRVEALLATPARGER